MGSNYTHSTAVDVPASEVGRPASALGFTGAKPQSCTRSHFNEDPVEKNIPPLLHFLYKSII